MRSLPALLLVATPLLLSASTAAARDKCPGETTVDPFEARALPDLVAVSSPSGSPAAAAGPAGDRPLRHVWVLDHSGSMYADYKEHQPRSGRPYYVEVPDFRRFVVDEVGANFRDGKDSAALVVFNELAYGWNGSSAVRIGTEGPTFDSLKVGSRADLAARLEHLPPPPYGAPVAGLPAPAPGANDCGAPGAASNCSKMLEGLAAARSLLDAGPGEGIIWLVTDNIYEGGAGSEELSAAERDQNRAFYQAIKATPEYRVVVAYPVVQGTAGAFLGGTSLFVYGIYYDKDRTRATPVDETRRLLGDGTDGVLASAPMTTIMKGYASAASPSPGRPFRLKPLDQDVVRISLAADVEQVKKNLEMGDRVKLNAVMRVSNLLDHRIIDKVTFRVKNAKWAGYEPSNRKATKGVAMPAIDTVCPDKFVSQPVSVENIGPGQSVEVKVPLDMPAVDYSLGSMKDMLAIAGNDSVVMGGVLQAELTDVRSRIFISPDAVKGTYGAESLPQVFENPQVSAYIAQFMGKTRKIENPGTVMAMLGLLGLIAAVGLLGLGSFMLTKVNRRLYVDGVDLGAISIPRMGSTAVNRRSDRLGSVSLSLSGVIRFRGTPGYSVRKDGEAWTMQKDIGPVVRVEFRSSKRR